MDCKRIGLILNSLGELDTEYVNLELEEMEKGVKEVKDSISNMESKIVEFKEFVNTNVVPELNGVKEACFDDIEKEREVA